MWKKQLLKLLYRLDELLPAKSRVFFIYTHRNGHDRFSRGLKANTEISYWAYRALRERFPRVSFLRLEGEKPSRIARITSCDVVIGHAGETYLKAAERTSKLIAFCPWAGHEDRSQVAFNCVPKEREMAIYKKAQTLIFLTSEYNVREYVEQPRNFWYPFFQEFKKEKRVRFVHQPIDLDVFSRIKWNYSTHAFLYIGNAAHMKCLPDAKRLVEHVGRKLTIYGVGEKKIDHLDSQAISHLPAQADFFIQPGMWEAQCVSILEAAARGFIPVVSPETGYPYAHSFLLRYGDFSYNAKVLQELLHTTPEERRVLADALHQSLVSDVQHNNWKRLTDVLVEEVKQLLCSRL